jgi:hypothetical protein
MRHSLGFNQSIGRRVKELQNETSGTSPGALVKGAFFIGSAALLLAMSIDAVAVLGRHLGWPLLGAIELVQACIVLAASAAIIVATLRGAHARVHILTERLPERWQRRGCGCRIRLSADRGGFGMDVERIVGRSRADGVAAYSPALAETFLAERSLARRGFVRRSRGARQVTA